MKRFEKIFSVIVLGTIPPVVLMLTFWWGSLPFLQNQSQTILILALSGFVLGLLLDCTLLRRSLSQLFELPFFALIAIELFYSIMVYGFFMGFPVFNVFVGIAGVYAAAKHTIFLKIPLPEANRSLNRMNRLSTIILLLLCTCSAVLALRESTICAQVKGMLNLPFPVTMPMIWTLILIGGFSLLLLQYAAARKISSRILIKNI